MGTTWDATFTNCVVDVTITASSNFTSTGNLMHRLVLVERQVNFPSAPGTNGEKDFSDPVRKCYSTVSSGTTISNFGDLLPGTWTAGQSQTLSINCAIPSYINDKGQMAFVGFIQDDGNKKIWQAARTAQPSIPDDASLVSINGLSTFSCSSNIPAATITFSNNGSTPIIAATINPYIDGAAQTAINWTGNLAVGAATTVATPSYPSTTGTHIFSVNITGVNGGDINPGNNYGSKSFGIVTNYVTAPLVEPFTSSSFPPVGWFFNNPNGGNATWSWASTVGNGGAGSLKYEFYLNSVVGDADDIILKPTDMTGVTNPILSFDHAYTGYTASAPENDKLDVRYSLDCGATWTNVWSKSGTALQTAPITTGYFSPNSSQWLTNLVAIPAIANQSQVLIMFKTTSAYGNNLYIDNINLTQSTKIQQEVANELNTEIFPNPAGNSATIKINTTGELNGNVVVYNSIGQIVQSGKITLSNGSNEVKLNTSELTNGVYNIVLTTDKGSVTRKLTVSK